MTAPKKAPAKKAPAKKAAPRKAKASPKRDAMDAMGIDAVVQQIGDGLTLTAIAAKAGVSIGTLLAWIERDPARSARAREARAMRAKLHDEEALTGIQKASDPFELARAREAAHHLRWRATKIAPKEYGEYRGLGEEVANGALVFIKDLTGRKDLEEPAQ